jgi:hypothetical protein
MDKVQNPSNSEFSVPFVTAYILGSRISAGKERGLFNAMSVLDNFLCYCARNSLYVM